MVNIFSTLALFYLSTCWLVFAAPPSHRATADTQRLVQIFVSPQGFLDDSDFCGSALRPCSLDRAIRQAPPGAELHLRPGVYTGCYRVSRPLRLVGSIDGAAILDGGSSARPLWFDNVPANIEGLTFQNGRGSGSGCVLVTRTTARHDEPNVILRSRFINCTSHSEGSFGLSAGALGITYARAPSSPAIELSRLSFISNYARSHRQAAGAALVRYASTAAPVQTCSLLYLNQPAELASELSPSHTLVRGLAFALMKSTRHAGKPVYKTRNSANAVHQGRPTGGMYLAYCRQLNFWALVAAAAGLSATEVLQEPTVCVGHLASFRCHTMNASCDSPLQPQRAFRGDQQELTSTPWHFTCQDLGPRCRRVTVHGAVFPQQHRNGLYEEMNVTSFGRPCFRQVNAFLGQRRQFMRYCGSVREWILSDDDPSTLSPTETECMRGVASGETAAMHPALVTSWRFWDTDAWRGSPVPAGIAVECAVDDMCPILSVVNFPTAVVGIQPTVVRNNSATSFQRPVFVDMTHTLQLWFCPKYREWAFSSLPPPLGEDSDCIRSLSCVESTMADPQRLDRRWEVFQTSQWFSLDVPLTVRCSEDCPRVHIEIEGAIDRSGGYDTVGRTARSGHRVYRQVEAPHTALFYQADRSAWVIADMHRRVPLYASRALFLPTEASPLAAYDWFDGNGSSVNMHVSCDTNVLCAVLNVTVEDQKELSALYAQLPFLIAARPAFVANYSSAVLLEGTSHHRGYVYYCRRDQRWVIGPQPSLTGCPSWRRAEATASQHPTLWTTWDREARIEVVCGKDSTASFSRDDADNAPTALMVNPGGVRNRREADAFVHVSDVISGCNFTNNRAISAGDASAAGALQIVFHNTPEGSHRITLARRLWISGNEGLSTALVSRAHNIYSAGGLIVSSEASLVDVQLHLHEGAFLDNRGHAGALLLHGIRLTAWRTSMFRNLATHVGGGFAALRSNVTFFHCTFKQNYAQLSGGCGFSDVITPINMLRCDLINNSAVGARGTAVAGGVVHITESRVLGIHLQAIAPRSLVLSSSELSCMRNMGPAALSSGFGCVPETSAESVLHAEMLALSLTPRIPPPLGDTWTSFAWSTVFYAMCLLVVAWLAFKYVWSRRTSTSSNATTKHKRSRG